MSDGIKQWSGDILDENWNLTDCRRRITNRKAATLVILLVSYNVGLNIEVARACLNLTPPRIYPRLNHNIITAQTEAPFTIYPNMDVYSTQRNKRNRWVFSLKKKWFYRPKCRQPNLPDSLLWSIKQEVYMCDSNALSLLQDNTLFIISFCTFHFTFLSNCIFCSLKWYGAIVALQFNQSR